MTFLPLFLRGTMMHDRQKDGNVKAGLDAMVFAPMSFSSPYDS